MSNIMLALGGYRFGINTAAHKTLQRSSRYRWQSQARTGRKPAFQYLGPDSDSITLDGEILPHFKGGLGQVNRMREQAGKGEPLILTDSDGNVWGKWCIASIEETWSDLMADGKPRRISFRLTLQEYGDDDQTTGGAL
ncbi:phage tail protein [Endozoicomonas gorgoniicola]|uniref:Phage tail protein n=1 Tax=Endozoicomonas gorgoniicola TaxID=1234144 RepID=A0ABT3MTB0_9GAMM|nr:phage tail protein [Endozoicomonas gorgoniicola]MCW7552605.1 phage tail protein [Endozoicomonas gorgoniicola]